MIRNITPKPTQRPKSWRKAILLLFSSESLGSISAAPINKKLPAIKQFIIRSAFSLRLATDIPIMIPIRAEKLMIPLQIIA